MDYEKAYKVLFNAITDALAALEKERMTSPDIERAKHVLIHAQQNTEGMFIEAPPTD